MMGSCDHIHIHDSDHDMSKVSGIIDFHHGKKTVGGHHASGEGSHT